MRKEFYGNALSQLKLLRAIGVMRWKRSLQYWIPMYLVLYFERISYNYKKQWNISINRFLKSEVELVTMNTKLITSLITVLILSAIVSAANSFNIAWSDKDFCYDQVGDGHFCFDNKKKCRHEQKQDEIAESPCYNKDRVV